MTGIPRYDIDWHGSPPDEPEETFPISEVAHEVEKLGRDRNRMTEELEVFREFAAEARFLDLDLKEQVVDQYRDKLEYTTEQISSMRKALEEHGYFHA